MDGLTDYQQHFDCEPIITDLINNCEKTVYLNLLLPERVTISGAVKPFLLNPDIRPLRSEKGEGRLLWASLKLAVVASLLPN